MKKTLLFLGLALCCVICKAQAPNWNWAIGGNNTGYGYETGLVVDTANNLFITGRTGGGTLSIGGFNISPGGTVPFVCKFDSGGNGKWLSSNYSFSGFAYADIICIDNNDNSYITSCDGSGDASYMQAFNSSGNLIWNTISYNQNCRGYGISADNLGNVYTSGHFSGSSMTFGSTTLPYGGSGYAGYLTKQDAATGNFKWATYVSSTGSSNNYNTTCRRITTDRNGNLYVCGCYQNYATLYSANGGPTITIGPSTATGGFSDMFVAEYDSSGNVLWATTATNAGLAYNSYYYSNVIAIDSCDNIYVGGILQGTAQFGTISVKATGTQNVYVAKYNTTAREWEWVKSGGSSGSDYLGSITLDKRSDVYVTGSFANNSATFGSTILSSGNTFVLKYANSNGALQWAQSATCNGVGGIAVNKQGYVYIAGGLNGTATFGAISLNQGSNGLFVAELDTVPERTITPIVNKNYCPGETVILPYSVTGSFNFGNVFTAQLSDSVSSFANATTIGDTLSNTSGGIKITIPNNIPPGTYLIRVISDSPSTSSWANGCGAYYQNNVYVNDFYVTIGGKLTIGVTPSANNSICSGSSITLKISGGTTYLWSTGATTDSIIVSPARDTSYSVQVNNGGCQGDTIINVAVTAAGTLDIEPQGYTLCYGSSVVLYVVGGGTNFIWTPSTGLDSTTTDSVIASPTATVTYTVTGTLSGGCVATGTDELDVIPAPNKPVISRNGDVLTSSATQGNQWYIDKSLINGATNQNYTIATQGCYDVSTINPANGCTATSDTICTSPTGINQLSITSNQLSTYPNPTTGTIYLTINSAVQNVNDWNLEITDVLGRRLYTKASLSYSNEIDISELSGGVYFITVVSKTGRGVFPIVKQN